MFLQKKSFGSTNNWQMFYPTQAHASQRDSFIPLQSGSPFLFLPMESSDRGQPGTTTTVVSWTRLFKPDIGIAIVFLFFAQLKATFWHKQTQKTWKDTRVTPFPPFFAKLKKRSKKPKTKYYFYFIFLALPMIMSARAFSFGRGMPIFLPSPFGGE